MLMVEPYASRPECQVAFLFFGISIVSSAALNFKPAKDSIRELISRRPLPTRTNFLLTLMLATICYALALLVPVISDAIAIKCCTSSPMVSEMLTPRCSWYSRSSFTSELISSVVALCAGYWGTA